MRAISLNNIIEFNKYIFKNINGINTEQEVNEYYLSKPLPIGNHILYKHDMGESHIEGWVGKSCALHLIGTPDDIEELSMLPGLIVREVLDETYFLYQHRLIGNDSESYCVDAESYFKCGYTAMKSRSDTHGYSECPDFRDPELLIDIEPFYEQQINLYERIYKIYIQMSDELIRTAYDRLNFFVSIRNLNKKMSIKNFIEYLS